MTLGFACVDAVQRPIQAAFEVAGGFLDPSRPKAAAVRSLLAFWIDSLRTPLDLCRQIGCVMNDPSEATGPRGAVAGGEVRFSVPVGSEATDPVGLEVPISQVGAVQVARPVSGAVLPAGNVYVSVSSTGAEVQVALIGLDSVTEFQQLGSRCGARLQVPDGRVLDIIATRT